MSRLNKREVLQLIKKEGTISRTDIGNTTGLTAPTVSIIVEHLVNHEKLVQYSTIYRCRRIKWRAPTCHAAFQWERKLCDRH